MAHREPVVYNTHTDNLERIKSNQYGPFGYEEVEETGDSEIPTLTEILNDSGDAGGGDIINLNSIKLSSHGGHITLTSLNGTQYNVSVNDAGTELVITPVD